MKNNFECNGHWIWTCLLVSGVQDTYCGLEHKTKDAAEKCRARTSGDTWEAVERWSGFYDRRWEKGGIECLTK